MIVLIPDYCFSIYFVIFMLCAILVKADGDHLAVPNCKSKRRRRWRPEHYKE